MKLILNFFLDEFVSGNFVRYYTSNHNIKFGRIKSFVMVNNILKAQIQRLLTFDEIPSHLKSQERFTNANQKLWLLEETVLPIIDITNIIDRYTIWLEDNVLPLHYNFSVSEIIYKFNNRWKVRAINLRHQHPTEHLQFQTPPPGIPVLKFFLDFYIDDFGT